MINEIMLQKNSDIIEAIYSWRSMTTDTLKSLVAELETESAFRQRILRLVKAGVLRSRLQKGFNKIVYPSSSLIEKLGIDKFNEENVRHDAVVSTVVSSLNSFKSVKSAKLPHDFKTKASWSHHAIEPDALLLISKNGNDFNVAIEIELWRKDRKRVFDKLVDYAKATEYDYVFYFFADRPAFESYQKRLNELIVDSDFDHLKVELKEKVVLVFNQRIMKKMTDIKDSEVAHKGQKKVLCDLL